MKALVYTEPYRLELRDEPVPEPAPGEALIRVHAAAICGSDMHGYHGADPRRRPPLVLGHEAAGEVVDGSHRGQRVVLNPLVTCGLCEDCTDGRSNLCRQRQLIGMARPGAFAEYVTLPERNLIPVPEGMDLNAAALTEPTATALHGIHLGQRCAFRPFAEGRNLVIGGGAIGALSALVLRWLGAGDVTVAETNPLRAAAMERLGFAVHDPVSAGPPGEDRFHLVVDAVGHAATRDAAIAAVRPGGVIVHIGLGEASSAMDARKLTLSEITFVGCYTYTPTDLRAALHALHAGALGPLDWIEQRPLADGDGAFADLDAGRLAAPKVVLRP
ncbi:zinc-dependent alcohol dehydrogenase [Spiribacter halobius]|uniref:Galactitol-1-phosphate 5-dehydrogenase n=1 Tax=Sediminicurvatus halobius TaxID=2182432 RepID=A0A2U2N5Q0_9GAMM|nr:alcohol dehydrogenase catalytic domain-containing protein [Spiribacter halobius]PWG64535.1 galactitol-1-phosphate 5-dehydrogenase [Spiribacter halobius]UEX79142.1 alcohol dehydrogenase catalytic domain-containing protein [Spiribacter halobius]